MSIYSKTLTSVIFPAKNALDAYKATLTKVHEDGGKLYLNPKQIGEMITELGQPHHLYLLSEDSIVKGDYMFVYREGCKKPAIEVCKTVEPIVGSGTFYNGVHHIHCSKIEYSTDSSLVKKHPCNCLATTYEGCSECLESIPSIPGKVILEFIKEYNKGTRVIKYSLKLVIQKVKTK